MNVGAQTDCLECRKIVNVGPHLVEVTTGPSSVVTNRETLASGPVARWARARWG
jgi:hypothetical protein